MVFVTIYIYTCFTYMNGAGCPNQRQSGPVGARLLGVMESGPRGKM